MARIDNNVKRQHTTAVNVRIRHPDIALRESPS
jgi:hypothetical protein